MLYHDGFQTYSLLDDGTMDTVLQVECPEGHKWTERFDLETAAEYRRPDGELNFVDLVEDFADSIECAECETDH